MKTTILVLQTIAAAVLIAVCVYAGFCLLFSVLEPGLQGRFLVAIRNASLIAVNILLLWLISRTLRAYNRAARVALVSVTLSISLLLLVGYATVYNLRTQERDWVRLREIADELKAQNPAARLVLPESSSTVVIREGDESGDIYRIVVNDPWIGGVIGVDLMQLDEVVVRLTPAGQILDVRIDYF